MLSDTKIIITGMHSSLKHAFQQYLENALSDFRAGRVTSTLPYYKRVFTLKYYNEKETEQIYENREFVFLHDGFGLLRSTLEENNLFVLSIEDYLMFPNRYHNKYDILTVWIDSTKDARRNNAVDKPWNFEDVEQRQLSLIPQFSQALHGRNLLYFCDLSFIEMYSRIVRYLEETDTKKKAKLLDAE